MPVIPAKQRPVKAAGSPEVWGGWRHLSLESLDVHVSGLEISLTCRFRVNRSEVQPRVCKFNTMPMLLGPQGFPVVTVPSLALSDQYWQNQLLKKSRSEPVGLSSWVHISLKLARVQGSYTAFTSQIFTCSDPRLLHLPAQSTRFAILGSTQSKELKDTMVDSPFTMVLSCCLSVYSRHLFQGATGSSSASLRKIFPSWDLKKAEIRCCGWRLC